MSYVVFVASRGLHLPVSWKSWYETDRVQCGRSDGSCGFCGVCYCLVIVWELSYGISCTKRIVFFLSLWWVISQLLEDDLDLTWKVTWKARPLCPASSEIRNPLPAHVSTTGDTLRRQRSPRCQCTSHVSVVASSRPADL